MGKISGFGLLELSRQRRRTGVLEGTSHVCEHCQGAGRVRSVESAALALLRALDEAASKEKGRAIEARASTAVALYLLNEKREAIAQLEANRRVRVRVTASEALHAGEFELNVAGEYASEVEDAETADAAARRPRLVEVEAEAEDEAAQAAEAEAEPEEAEEAPRAEGAEREDREDDRNRRRRRGRRGGRRRREDGEDAPVEARDEEGSEEAAPAAARESREDRSARGRRRRRGRGRGGRKVYEVDGGEWLDFVSSDLKHLSPRPARPQPAPRRAAGETRPAREDVPGADIIVHPAAEPVTEPAREPAYAAADIAPMAGSEPAEAAPRYDAASLTYEPDQERREKFLSRLSRWAKKN